MRKLAIILTALISTLASAQQRSPLKNLLGVNCRADNLITAVGVNKDSQNRYNPIKQATIVNSGTHGLRIYVDATVNKSVDNTQYRFSPDGRGFRLDSGINGLRRCIPDLFVNIAYQNQPVNIQNEWTGIKSSIYRHLADDPNLPSTYSEIAHDCGVFAGLGGSNKNNSDYPLFVSPNWWENVYPYQQAQYEGAGFFNSIAPGNEQDNPWTNDRPLNGAQYAAEWKSTYDSVKKYDPNMIVSSTGVMTQEPQILSDAIQWCNTNNAGKLPFDEYEFHCYPFGWSKNIASALPPEMTAVPAFKKIKAAAPNVSFVVGEWSPGDRDPRSTLGIQPFSNYTGEQIQAYWGARWILWMAATGMKRGFNYQAYQSYGHLTDTSGEQFVTSSLFIEESDGSITRFLIGDVIKQLGAFGNYYYESTIVDDGTKVILRFTNGINYLYVGWTVEQVQLVTINGTNRAQFTETKANYTFPSGTRLDLAKGDVMTSQPYYGASVELSSKPVFIQTLASLPIDTTPKQKPPIKKPKAHYHYEVVNILGQVLQKGESDDIEATKNKVKSANKVLIIHYWNDKNNYTDKLLK